MPANSLLSRPAPGAVPRRPSIARGPSLPGDRSRVQALLSWLLESCRFAFELYTLSLHHRQSKGR